MELPPVLIDEKGQRHTIAVWDNDGIVNTVSMLWRQSDNTGKCRPHGDCRPL
jgi:hypothetical protein